jgi:hypothetical protein
VSHGSEKAEENRHEDEAVIEAEKDDHPEQLLGKKSCSIWQTKSLENNI